MTQARRGVALVKRGLLAEWRYDTGSGTTLVDRGPDAQHGTFVNTPAWVATGLDFVPAELDYITTALIPRAAGTLQVLFAPDAFGSGRIMLGCIDATNGRCFLSAGDGTSNVCAAGVGGQTNSIIRGTTVLSAGAWYLGTLTWSGTLVQLYVNAGPEYSAAQSGVVTSTNAIYVGARNTNGTVSSNYDGKLSWSAVYGRVLSGPEIARNLRYVRRLKAPVLSV